MKLKAFNQAVLDIEFAEAVIAETSDIIQKLKPIEISSTITLNSKSTTKQFIYGVSILRNQIVACEELGIDPTEYRLMKADAIELRGLIEELDNWKKFLHSLLDYKSEVFALLNEKERFQLLQYPTKP